MKSKLSVKKAGGFVFMLILVMTLICSMAVSPTLTYGASKDIKDVSEMKEKGIRIAYSESLGIDDTVREKFPDAEISYYVEVNGIEAVRSGMIDVYICDTTMAHRAIEVNPEEIRILEEPFLNQKVAFAISGYCKVPDIEEETNTFLDEMKNSGELDELFNRWVFDSAHAYREIAEVKNPEYTLRVGTFGGLKPYTYYENNMLIGSDVELAKLLGQYLNAKVVFETADFAGLLAGIAGGKYDIIASNLFVNNERQNAITYSEPYFDSDLVYIVHDSENGDAGAAGISKGNSLKDSIYKNLIAKQRYKLILSGLMVTLIVTLGGFILANLMGAVLCWMNMSKYRILRAVVDVYSHIAKGTPMVVILLILYYIIFARSSISGVAVAIIGFGLAFAAGMAGTFEMGIRSVGKEQWEGAEALGFTRKETLKGIVLPQAIINITPSWFEALINMTKGTAIAGYIAVVDLTKAGDLIRSSTFDAFVPLILIAIIYFLIITLLLAIQKSVRGRIDPKNKKRMVKGVVER